MFKYALDSQQMRDIEEPAISSADKALLLMERAGLEVYKEIVANFAPGNVLVMCGPGNNGGDGYVVAELLLQAGWTVNLLKIAEAKTNSAQYFAKKYSGIVIDYKQLNLVEVDLIVDAIYGIGLDRNIDADVQKLITQVNAAHKSCVAIDMPSGIAATTGEILGEAITATLTITFHSKKLGHVLMPGLMHAGKVIVKDIGLPKIKDKPEYIKINTPDIWKHQIKLPQCFDNKYSRGCLAVIAGQMLGAARLAIYAARKSGCGIVKLFIQKSQSRHLVVEPGVVVVEYDDIDVLCKLISQHKVNAILYGPGTLVSDSTENNVIRLLALGKSMVIDAGAILNSNVLANAISNTQDVLLTPHAREFTRVFNIDSQVNKLDQVNQAMSMSGCTMLLKGMDTVIGSMDNMVIQDNGCPYLATAGTGDVLAGICGALMSQGIKADVSAMIATWVLSESAWRLGYGLLAEEIPIMIPKILQDLIDISKFDRYS